MDMVDEKKTILMTKLAIFEKHEKNKSLVVSKYYRSDYVRYNVLKTWVAVTVLYWCVIAGYIFMTFDSILEKLNDLDYFAVVYKMLGGYVIICAIYFLFAFILYNYRYKKARNGLVQYNINLKELIHADDPPEMQRRMVDDTKRTTDAVKRGGNRQELHEKIRAPYIESVGDGVDVLATCDGKIVAARQGKQLVTAFHPELTEEVKIHQYFVDMISEN